MNRNVYRLVFNKQRGMLVAVSEVAVANGKEAGQTQSIAALDAGVSAYGSAWGTSYALRAVSFAACLAWGVVSSLGSSSVHAQNVPTNTLPTNGVVQAGSATGMGTSSIVNGTNTMVVTQSTNRAVINWGSFSIGSGSAVQFVQPTSNSVVLNNVANGGTQSFIDGSLSSNGHVYLSNNSGVLIGRGGSINTGSFIATTLGINTNDFMAGGKLTFFGNSNAGVENQGTITTTNGGSVALVGAQIVNSGTITTPGGTTALAAGQSVDLDFNGDRLWAVRVNTGSEGGSISNTATGVIAADNGGRVIMTAATQNALLSTVLNVKGRVSAKGITTKGGEIFLDSGAGGTTVVDGGTLDASSSTGQGGSVKVLGKHVGLFGAAQVDASGATGGGEVLVGGNWQGSGTERNAQVTLVGKDAVIKADATQNGNGGTVVVWADDRTKFDGSISARGGAQGGDGGHVETSGKNKLGITTGRVNVQAANGKGGKWLLDPNDITIDNANTNLDAGVAAPDFQDDGGAANAVVDAAVIGAALTGGATVTVQTSGNGAVGRGDITVASTITSADSGTLNLIAHRNIDINADIRSGGGALSVGLYAGAGTAGSVATIAAAGTQAGAITQAGRMTTDGGNVVMVARGDVSLGTIDTGAGNLNVNTNGGGTVTQTAALTVGGTMAITATGQAITLSDAGNAITGTTTLTGATTSFVNTLDTTVVLATTGATDITASGMALTASGTTTGGVLTTSAAATTLGTLSADSASITATGAVTQTGAATISGATTVAAGSNDITLANAANNFNTISLTGGAITVKDTNALTVSALTSAANKAVDIQAGTTLTLPATAINTGTAALTLASNGGTLTTANALTGNNVQLTGFTGISLGHVVTATGTLGLTSTNANIVQTAGSIAATGTTTVAAGTGAATLTRAANDFSSVTATGGAVSVTDANAVTLNAISASSLDVIAGGNIAQTAAATVTGNTVITNTLATASTNLNNAGNNFAGTLGLNLAGGTAAVTSTSGFNLAASSLANTAVQLTATGAGRSGQQFDVTAGGTGTLAAAPVTGAAVIQSGAITQGATGTLTITAPTTSKVLLNNQANTLDGQISVNAATGAMDVVEIQSTKVNVGTGGIYANTVVLKANSVTTPTATSIIKIVQNPVNNYQTNALFMIDYLVGAGNATFGLAGTGNGIKVDMQNGALPIFYQARTNSVYLEGPTTYKPLYDFADDATARLMFYNGQPADSPTLRAALNAAMSPLRDALKEALSAGYSKENMRRQLEQGVVLETGLARPGIDKADPAPGAQECASGGELTCAQ